MIDYVNKNNVSRYKRWLLVLQYRVYLHYKV